MPIITTIISQNIPKRMGKTKKICYVKFWWGSEKLELSETSSENAEWYNHFGKHFKNFLKS